MVYESLDNSHDIFTIDLNNSDVVQLTNTNVDNKDPTWSPDGTKIAFVKGNEDDIYVMGAEDGEQGDFRDLHSMAIMIARHPGHKPFTPSPQFPHHLQIFSFLLFF